MTKEIVLATHNQHKIMELRSLLGSLDVTLIPQGEKQVKGAEETASTFLENALIKARHACRLCGLPAIADDSGLSVVGLNGEPGIRSARYAGPAAEASNNNRLLLQRIREKELSLKQRRAFFCSVLVYLEFETDPTPTIAIGNWEGSITLEPRGTKGFGYDPLFVPDGCDRTVAELEPEIKNRMSHRGQAARQFVDLLTQRLDT